MSSCSLVILKVGEGNRAAGGTGRQVITHFISLVSKEAKVCPRHAVASTSIGATS
jgi:hypothetical protein